ncbi:MAG TPA: hypothetical protein VHO03_19255 [Ignavibacteriales bacterium]|nr:hypothetical protein [Ignavibacteriales bacterium]
MKQIKRTLKVAFFYLPMLIFNSCKDDSITSDFIDGSRMLVYARARNEMYSVDVNTFQLKETIPLNMPGQRNLILELPCISTDRSHLIFSGKDETDPQIVHYLLSFNLAKKKFDDVFKTGLYATGAERVFAAQNKIEPGLFYFYSQNNGLFAFDYLREKLVNTYFNERRFSEQREFYLSPDGNHVVVSVTYGTQSPIYTEVYFFNTQKGLKDPEFILNEKNKDQIYIDDLQFSEDGQKLYLSFMNSSNERPRNSFIGYYDLNAKSLHTFPVNLPWSINPYYIAYNEKRHEIYTNGAYDKLYVIDADHEQITGEIHLGGKQNGPSSILVRSDGKIVFVSCADSDFIAVVDPEKGSMIQKISLTHPYLMIIP